MGPSSEIPNLYDFQAGSYITCVVPGPGMDQRFGSAKAQTVSAAATSLGCWALRLRLS